MERLNITKEECEVFPGGWSVDATAMYYALDAVRYADKLKILEFGSGAGTSALVGLLDKRGVTFDYTSYENNIEYMCPDHRVRTMLWEAFPRKVRKDVYDFVIIDGPHGVTRENWYPLIKPVVRAGTIILVDDWMHYAEFMKALDANFTYRAIKAHAEYTATCSYITWLIVEVIAAK